MSAIDRTRRHAGAKVLADRAHVVAEGRHRARFLHAMTTCQVNLLQPGEGRFGMTVDAHGKLVASFFLDAGTEAIRLEVDAARRELLLLHLRRHVVADRVTFSEVDGLAVVALVGPGAAEVLGSALGVPAALERPYSWRDVELAGVAARLRANPFRVGLPGFDLTVAAGDTARVREALAGQGAARLGDGDWETLRLVAGVPRDGVDVGEEDVPLESEALYAEVDFDKGCYLGQEVIAMMHYRGKPNRLLRGLRLDAGASLPSPSPLPSPGTALLLEGKDVGRTGSAVVRTDTGEAFALGVVKRKAAEPGTVLEIAGGGRAELVLLPVPVVETGG